MLLLSKAEFVCDNYSGITGAAAIVCRAAAQRLSFCSPAR